jgi:subtilisin family serine protease
MVAAVPAGSTLTKLKPANVTDAVNGYMMLSGTSFAAPIVSAAAAQILAQHPTWGPDQVKGALMVTATPEPKAVKGSLGVGDVNIAAARTYRTHNPPNPNAGLEQFLSTASDGTRTFNSSAWQQAALSNKAWDTAAWSDVAWSDAAWSTAAWSDVAWADAAWASVAYGTAAWSDVAWSDAAWSDAAWADNASGDDDTSDIAPASTDDQTTALGDLGIVDATCDPTISVCDTTSTLTGTVTSTTSSLLP